MTHDFPLTGFQFLSSSAGGHSPLAWVLVATKVHRVIVSVGPVTPIPCTGEGGGERGGKGIDNSHSTYINVGVSLWAWSNLPIVLKQFFHPHMQSLHTVRSDLGV